MSLILAALSLLPAPPGLLPKTGADTEKVEAFAGSKTRSAGGSMASSAQDEAAEAVRAALKAAPRRGKVGRIRGLRAKSSVRFLAAPNDPYVMLTSFGFPERSRVVLSSAGGAFERYQLGSTLFGRDVVKGAASKATGSFVLKGAGRSETLLDMELRRALFLWPDAPKFEGKGTTFVAKVETVGILLATVDEVTGLPSRIRAFGQDGKAGAEFHSVLWGEPTSEDTRRWPTSFTFAASGQDLWEETVQCVENSWRFSDIWFLPSDLLTAVMGAKTEGEMRVRALDGAWVYRVPMEGPSGDKPEKETVRSLVDVADAAASGWHDFQGTVQAAFSRQNSPIVSPHVTLVLDENGEPIAWEYEALGTEQNRPTAKGWRWRSPKNYWAYPLTRESASSGGEDQPGGLKAGSAALASLPDNGGEAASPTGVRLRVGEDTLNGTTRTVAVELELITDAPLGGTKPNGDPDEDLNKTTASQPQDKRGG